MTDPLGLALSDFYFTRRAGKLWIHNTYGPKEEMPVAAYFRDYIKMPALEHAALRLCRGKILDIGAGPGSHSLWLQQQGHNITALEISADACVIMKERGILNIVQRDIFKYHKEQYNTLLLLMNGIGLTGTLEGLRRFLRHASTLLLPGGQLIFDSSDVAYVYEHNLPDLKHYYGEIAYRYEYKRKKSGWFNWLYIDRFTMAALAAEEGWKERIVTEDKHGQYLVVLTKTVVPAV